MTSPKIVFVTGGNNGIGYETVKVLLESEQAYHILLGSRSFEKGTTAIDNLRKEYPSSASKLELVQVDLISDESIQKAYDQVKSSHDRLDILVNNAGTYMSIAGEKRN
jgi:NAD(P)-dependent dehydrogenase (short-subunit alcohol dehydrogenase family)